MTKEIFTKYLILPWLIVLFFPVYGFAESNQSKINTGISLYKEQEYDKAAERFLEAHIDEPDNAALVYNLANSNYKAGRFAEAIQGYGRAASEGTDPELKQKVFYNIGNSLFRLGKLEEAVRAYKKALELDSEDMDAKFNLEFTREQLKKKQQGQQQDKNKQKKDFSENKDEQQQSSPNERDRGKSDDHNQNPKENQTGKNAEQAKNREQEQNQHKNSTTAQTKLPNGEISKEEAEQWLRSLQENLKKFSKKQIREYAANPEYKGKDW